LDKVLYHVDLRLANNGHDKPGWYLLLQAS